MLVRGGMFGSGLASVLVEPLMVGCFGGEEVCMSGVVGRE